MWGLCFFGRVAQNHEKWSLPYRKRNPLCAHLFCGKFCGKLSRKTLINAIFFSCQLLFDSDRSSKPLYINRILRTLSLVTCSLRKGLHTQGLGRFPTFRDEHHVTKVHSRFLEGTISADLRQPAKRPGKLPEGYRP